MIGNSRKNRRIMSRIMVLLLMLGLILSGLAPVVAAEESDSELLEVSFDPQGGSGTMASIFCNPLDEVTLPENGFTEPEGKSFKVWEIDGQEYAPGAVVTVPTNTIVKAVWKDVEDGLSELSGNVSAAAEEPGKDSLSEGKAGQDADTDIESELQEPNGQEETSSSVKVASVNGIQYETLQAAIDAAAEGDTVSLLVDRTEWVEVNKTLTLDLSGHTLTTPTGKENHPAITITSGSFPTIKNGTIVGGQTTGASYAGAIAVEGALFNLSDLIITGCIGPGFAIQLSAMEDSFAGSNMDINKLTVSNNTSHVIFGNTKSDITFTDCHFDNNLPEKNNRLLALGGRGNKTFNNCTFLNNKAQGIADVEAEYINCRFEGNECWGSTVSAGSFDPKKVSLVNSVVKNNTCTNEFGVAGVNVNVLILENSAVYRNKNTAGGMNDLGENCKDIDATQMKDPTDPTMDFSNYVVDDTGTVLKIVEIFEAEIDGTRYKLLTEAVEAAQTGDTIKLINTNEAGDIKPVSVNTVWIQKDITIDLNGRNVENSDGWSFCLAGKAGKLSLINSSDQAVFLYGSLYNKDMDSTLQIGDKIIVARQISHNENTIIDGNHHRLNLTSRKQLNNGVTMPVTFGDNFEYTGRPASLFMSLAESKDDLNDPKTAVPDIVIAHNATADLADKISLSDISNPLVRVVFRPTSNSSEFGDLVVKKELSSTVYLDGENGDDTADGLTKDTAVKTFDQAKDLAEALAENDEKIIIYVCGTIDVEATEIWSFSDKDKIIMYREPTFSGHLIQIASQGHLTLENITIDGNKNNAYAGKNSLIMVDGGKLSILTGASLQNNKLTDMSTVKIADDKEYPCSVGGAVNAGNGSTVNLNGGTISGNTAVWGGGIFARSATINIDDGLITQNHAVDNDHDMASGGGIATWYESIVNIRGGTISQNFSEGNGGGLSLGVSYVINVGSLLCMDGGSFIDNTAQSSGGGLFVQGGMGEGYARASVEGGLFQKNTAQEGFFGGGGIYVNGGHNWPGFSSGKLYLTNALITKNTAGRSGGGYASCPTSSTVISAKNGAAFIANDAPSGREIHINATVEWEGRRASPEYAISDSMLGGSQYHWMYDDETEVPLQRLHGLLDIGTELNLNNQVAEEAINSAQELAKVIISENHAGRRGGGIGSNGDVYIGTSEVVELKVNKIWEDDDDIAGKRPQSIKVGLYRTVEGSDEEPIYIGYNPIKEDAEGNWSTTFENLPKSNEDGKLFVYTVKEEAVGNGYKSAVTGNAETGFILTNTRVPGKTSVQVTAAWEDNNDQDGKRPASVTLKLLADGIDTKKTLILTKNNNWTGTFSDLDEYNEAGQEIEYTVKVEPVGNGYASEVTGDAETGFTVKITKVTEKTVVEGTITWNDNNDQAGKRPQSITIRLWKNGVEIDSKTVTEADGWAWSFTDLAKYENGKLISYTITEDAIDGYSSEVSGYNVINSYSPDKPAEPTTPIEPMEPTSLSEPTKTIISTEPMKSTTPAESTKPTGPALLPRAGENSDPYLWLSIMCMSVGTSLLLFRRKNTK